MLIRLRILWLNLAAVAGAVAALVPLVPSGGPRGHRTQVPRAAARVIPFQQRRRASPAP